MSKTKRYFIDQIRSNLSELRLYRSKCTGCGFCDRLATGLLLRIENCVEELTGRLVKG